MEKFIAKIDTPLGASYNEDTKCVDFKLYSKNATKVLLCIFENPQGEDPVMVLDMAKNTDNVWQTSVKDYILNCHKKPVYYAYRVFGPNWDYSEAFEPGTDIGFVSKFDASQNRFNPNKLAFDPYSRELSHLPSDVNPGLNMFRSGGKFHYIDNAKWAIKSVFRPIANKEMASCSIRPFQSEIIGEVHIKDLTQNINMLEHGTYRGASKFAKSIKELGITTVEFLPLNEFDSRQNGVNYWGYMPLDYFSLARKYAFDKTQGSLIEEFRTMVDEFHKNDIKVCLDMVYNHTGEAGLINHNVDDAVLLSYALIDNASYYKVYRNGYYRSNSGCGNDFNIGSEAVLNLVVDSIVFWANQGVDAFRFDLAAALLEDSCDCNEIYSNINSLAAKLKDRLNEKGIDVIDDFTKPQKGIALIAEPWTCGEKDCYQLGNFPSFWLEWNDVFRDQVRKITLRPHEINPAVQRDLVEGTPSRFKGNNKAVNYIASHDGFTLFDLNNFTRKSNSTQGGSDWEVCGDYKNDPYLRVNAIRKQLAFLMLSYGVPMIQIGDIIMHTKNGNNNSYNKDDGTNYLNWQKATRKDSMENTVMEYARNLMNFRKENPIFASTDFKSSLSYHYDNGEIADINNDGYWHNQKDVFFGYIVNSPEKRIYVASNKDFEPLKILLPKAKEGKEWRICFDTSNFRHTDCSKKESIASEYILNPQALAVFEES